MAKTMFRSMQPELFLILIFNFNFVLKLLSESIIARSMHQLLKESANLRFFVNQMYLVDPMSFIAVLVFVAHEFMIVGVNVVDYFLPDKFFVRKLPIRCPQCMLP